MSPSGSKHQVKAFLIGMGMLGLCTLCKRFASMSTSYASVCIKMCNKDIYIYISLTCYIWHLIVCIDACFVINARNRFSSEFLAARSEESPQVVHRRSLAEVLSATVPH